MREPNFPLQFQYPSDVVQDQVFISGTRRSPSLRHELFRFFRGYDIWSSWNMKVFRSFRFGAAVIPTNHDEIVWSSWSMNEFRFRGGHDANPLDFFCVWLSFRILGIAGLE